MSLTRDFRQVNLKPGFLKPASADFQSAAPAGIINFGFFVER